MARLRRDTKIARSLWTGSINFGLVNVPVKAFTAVRDHDVHFHQLDKKSGSRIRYRKVAERPAKKSTPTTSPWDMRYAGAVCDVRRGGDEGASADVEPGHRSVRLRRLDEIDPIYYENTYWLVPDGEREEGYQLLLAAMEDEERVGIGSVVIGRSSTCASAQSMACWRCRRCASQTRSFPCRRSRACRGAPGRPEGVEDGQTELIDGLSSEWEPKQYRDTYTEELRKRIKRKDHGKEVVEADDKPEGQVST